MIRGQAKVLQFALLLLSVTGQASATEPEVDVELEEVERGQGSRCVDVDFSVALDPSTPEEYRIAGELCVPRGRRSKTLQILIHGASYNRHYWDFPHRPRRYSYVRHANDSGYATLAIDRLGSGDSDRPVPELVTVHASAYTIHQVV